MKRSIVLPYECRDGAPELERRAFTVDGMKIERREKEASRIIGHASVFNREANIGGWFIESVAPGAFRRAIAEDDVRALFNHDPNFVLGRNRAGTLRLSEDDIGLAIEITPPDTQAARDLMTVIERGDVSQMSIGFRALKQEWDESGDVLKRKLTEVELFDVSPVTFPAFPQTDVSVRELEAYRKAHPKAKGLTTVNARHIVRTLTQRARQNNY
jgi:HK97 family phage prohead protease